MTCGDTVADGALRSVVFARQEEGGAVTHLAMSATVVNVEVSTEESTTVSLATVCTTDAI